MICGKVRFGLNSLASRRSRWIDSLLGGLDNLANGNLRKRLPQRAHKIRPHAVIGKRDQILGRELPESGIAEGSKELRSDSVFPQFDNFIHGDSAISGGDQSGQEGTAGGSSSALLDSRCCSFWARS